MVFYNSKNDINIMMIRDKFCSVLGIGVFV